MMRPYKVVNPGTAVDIPTPIPLTTSTTAAMTTTTMGPRVRDCMVHNVSLAALSFIPNVVPDVQIGDQVNFIWT
jgi:hypothetical protein